MVKMATASTGLAVPVEKLRRRVREMRAQLKEPAVSAEGRRILLVTDGDAGGDQLRVAGADVTPVCWDAAGDDTAWLPFRELLSEGWFDSAVIELPYSTWGRASASSRSPERPQGVLGLQPAVKETLRAANHQVKRAAEVAEAIRRIKGAWAVGGPAGPSGTQP